MAVIGGSDYPINNALSPPATGCDIIVPSEPEFRRQKSYSEGGGIHRDEKKSFGNNGLFPQMIALHHPLRHLPRVRLDASQSADSGNYYFFVI
ncbi:hypothetical protein ELH22_16265 [Rhizobium ruizarguesonis]|uniref:hypothetical protein n=1 Tax=Rhizobium ruizarguesonis TaxID=2081791 RepID=UPI00102FF22D|nr:hypothetical protein [Rhizobium ruizarguesonis]TBD64751.1 hypothetical protein ELH22_16265 [Rhizobium ruizarguesonis]